MDSTKLTIPIHIVGTICLALASGVGAYYKAISDIRTELATAKLEVERGFVRKGDMDDVKKKLSEIAEGVAEIRGRLPRR